MWRWREPEAWRSGCQLTDASLTSCHRSGGLREGGQPAEESTWVSTCKGRGGGRSGQEERSAVTDPWAAQESRCSLEPSCMGHTAVPLSPRLSGLLEVGHPQDTGPGSSCLLPRQSQELTAASASRAAGAGQWVLTEGDLCPLQTSSTFKASPWVALPAGKWTGLD